jgi:uncharacterized protein YjbJ (UPF0337 family)
MNEDIFAGQWRQMQGELRSWWGKLTDDDFERIGGQKDKLVGVIQERYGYTRDEAQRQVERRFDEYQGARHAGLSASRATGENLRSKASEFATTAASKARDARAGVSSGLETAGAYLKQKELGDVASDISALVRKYPVQSVLIGAGLIYLISRTRNR